jgi:hypothetical protein
VPDILPLVFVVAGYALVIAIAARLGAGSTTSLADTLASPTMPARPRGVQESDLPRFVFREATAVDANAPPARAVAGRVYETGAA